MDDTAADDAWWVLTRLQHDIATELDEVLVRAHGLSLSWLEVLRAIATGAKPSRVLDISAAVALSASRVCRVLHTMEERGLVIRTSSPSDARATEVRLTEEGFELRRRAQEDFASALQRALTSRLSADDVRALTGVGRRAATAART
ncbi:DNA-binding MarR family transcriptional regulator [Saccharothrix saharensis]|uniref:DNA-binding MarR family transcriptional regulator n=1 Tax=Saccharothrix saharensis TaxID=571190 RepID=A0A543J6D7_9PSEU|nr:MarR family transcriptional regulator [Saccharothrix saharensis]TQM78405.1 DNA-binding MarR family transcriptional regulator [Saccharothrix saharensis]